MRRLAVWIVLVMAVSGLAQATPVWFASTGQGVAPGAQDPNWEILFSNFDDTNYASLGNAYAVVDNGWPGSWVANDSKSQWLATRANYPLDPNIDAEGYYMFRTTFYLTSVPSSPEINGFWAADNQGIRIDLNGTSISLPGGNAYASMQPFTLTSGFLPGWNTFAIVVHNDLCSACGPNPNPIGARVEIPTPEPASLFLIGAGLLVIAGLSRRRMK